VAVGARPLPAAAAGSTADPTAGPLPDGVPPDLGDPVDSETPS